MMGVTVDSSAIVGAILIAMITIWYLGWLSKAKSTPTVTDLKIYPNKSCGAITLAAAHATETGFENDRIAQISDADGTYCTPRHTQYAKLFHIQPKLSDRDNDNDNDNDNGSDATKHKKLLLSSPNATHELELDLVPHNNDTRATDVVPMTGPTVNLQDYGEDATQWIEQATGVKSLRLTRIGTEYQRHVTVNEYQNEPLLATASPPVSLANEAPYLLTSTSSLQDLNQRLRARNKDPVDMRRFRPNIVDVGLAPWEDDSLARVRIGTAEFWVWQRCGRCSMTTVNRDTLERSSEPLATLGTFRLRENGQRNFGMHLIPVPGTVGNNSIIQVGDALQILEYDAERQAEWKRLFG